MIVNDHADFTISVTGESTGQTWHGNFKVKRRLTHRDQLRKDQIRRELLGIDADQASSRARNQAEIFSRLAVQIISAPTWWTENSNGLDMSDDNIIAEIYNQAVEIEAKAIGEIQAAGEAAKKELSKPNQQ